MARLAVEFDVSPSTVLTTLSWRSTAIAARLLDAAVTRNRVARDSDPDSRP